jgi:hypothetical protein
VLYDKDGEHRQNRDDTKGDEKARQTQLVKGKQRDDGNIEEALNDGQCDKRFFSVDHDYFAL